MISELYYSGYCLCSSTSRFVTWIGVFSQDRHVLWLSKDDLQESVSWSSPPLAILRDIHSGLLPNYDCKDSTPPQSQPGGSARLGPTRKTGIHISRRTVISLFRNSTVSMSYSLCGERTFPTCPPSLPRRELQHKSSTTGDLSRYSNRSLSSRTVLSSSVFVRNNVSSPLLRTLLRTELGELESQEEDAPNRVVCHKPIPWVGVIRPHHRDATWSDNDLGDHVSTCTVHSGDKKAYDRVVEQITDLFHTTLLK